MIAKNISRREFLKWQMAAALGSTSLFPLMGTMSNANAALVGDDYKALVCVFLYGGNDSFNMIVPRSTNAHNDYATARQNLAVNRNTLLPISPATYNDGTEYGFHSNMPEVKQLFDQKALSIIANVGMLTEPISKSEYEAKSKSIPNQLFSHADQQDQWMKARAGSAQPVGWAGRMADLLYPDLSQSPKPSVNITTWQPNLWQTGTTHSMYEIPAEGISPLSFPWHEGAYPLDQAYRDIYALGAANSHPMISHFGEVQHRSDQFSDLISRALKSAPSFSQLFPPSAQNNVGERGPLGKQLEMVAKLIAVRKNLDSNTTRQVFFVGFSGWDTHDNQVHRHAGLLLHLSKSLNAFYSALNEMGLANEVTTFTASEFGRTLTPNNNGTDHAWGGHNLVMGGSINGGDIFGTMPMLKLDSPDAVEAGRIIPTTSVEQYAATLASWYGLMDQQLDIIFPNLHRFRSRNLGFLT